MKIKLLLRMAIAAITCVAHLAYAQFFTNDLTDAVSVAAEFHENLPTSGNGSWSYTNDYALAQDGTTNTVLQGGAVVRYVTTDDDSARSYLATDFSAYADHSWVAHIAVETVNENPKNYIFFGLGKGEPNSGFYNEPTVGDHIFVSWQSGTSSSKVAVKRNGTTVENTGSWQGDPGYDIYMTYDHIAQTIRFEIDNWNGGRFSDIDVTTATVSTAGYLNDTNNMHIFFGGNGTMTFRDFDVKEIFQFKHPGLPMTVDDLDAIKANLNIEPWKTGYEALVSDSRSSLDYEMQGPFASVSRTPHVNLNEFKNDMQAIYNLSRMWYYTENEAYAQKAHDMLISWSTNHTSFDGGEIYLSMGDYTYRVFGGADILRGTWPGWTQADTELCKTYFENLYWNPDIIAVPHPLRSANQGILQLISGVGVAIFNDDQEKFDLCLQSFRADPAGGLLNSLPNGQIGDTGRDSHSYGELQHLAWIAEAFWKQGVDVFSDADNRLLAAGEYLSRYNLGIDTPFVQAGTVYDVYPRINTLGNTDQAVSVSPDALNIIHGHYVVRKGMSAPYLETYRAVCDEDSETFDRRKEADSSTASIPPPLAPAAAVASVTSLNSVNIGDCTSGSASYSAGTWTVSGKGTTLWYNSTPDYHFAYLPVTGDATLIAQVTGLSGGSSQDARAGLVFTENLSDTAAMAAVLLTNPSGDAAMYSFTRGDVAHSHPGNAYRTYQSFPDPKFPYWLKIERIGDRVTLYSSPDGASWSTAHCADYDIGSTAYFGLAVSSDQYSSTATATFTDVRITGGDGGEAPDVPAAPFAVYASPTDSEVTLRWLESFEATHYNVLRATSIAGPYETIAQETGTWFVDTDITPGTAYYYAVSAENEVGISSRSKIDYTRSKPDVYEAEDYDANNGMKWENCSDFRGGQNTSFGAAGDWLRFNNITIGSNAVFIARVATGNTSAAGQIEVRLGSSSGALAGALDVPDTGGWQDWQTVTTVLSATPGTYSVYLKFADLNSTGGSSIFNLNWFDIIQADGPTHLRATPISASQIDLYWDEMEGATSYRLKRSTSSGGPYTVIQDSAEFSYIDTGCSAGTPYYYVVSAEYGGIESSDSVEVMAVPSAPIRYTDMVLGSVTIENDGAAPPLFSTSVPVSGLGHAYRIKATDSLINPEWQDVSGVIPGNGSELLIEVPVGPETNRFYRFESWRQ
ncbi:carbohydrate-binding protein [Pontiellaceae bacterium B12219]|nr:carbohydrate-binding protein [Pontiellaceae bacterium B12219]